MYGKYCRLELFVKEQHAFQLFRAFGQSEEVFRNNLYGPFSDQASFNEWLSPVGVNQIQFVAYQNDCVCGIISIHGIDLESLTAEIGITLSTDVHNTQVSTESVYLILKMLFEDHDFRRIQWHCSCKNLKSINAARRLGFKEEAICRNYYVYKSEQLDGIYFSILDHEWSNCKNKLLLWLDKQNFDDLGWQKSRLNSSIKKYTYYSSISCKQLLDLTNVVPPNLPVLAGKNFYIEKMDLERHGEMIVMLANSQPEMFKFKNYQGLKSLEDFKNWFERFNDRWYHYCIFDGDSQYLLGVVSLFFICAESGVAELLLLMVPKEIKENELFQEAFDTIKNYLFAELKYQRLQLQCPTADTATIKVLEGLLLSCDGILRKSLILNHISYDMALFSITPNNNPLFK